MSSWDQLNPSRWRGMDLGTSAVGGHLQSHSAWPPYRLPSEHGHGTAHMANQGSVQPISRSSLALQPFSRTEGVGVSKGTHQVTPGVSLQSTSSHVPIPTPLQSSSAFNSSQGGTEAVMQRQYSFDEGSAKSDMYHMAHLIFPKTWVHLWDRAPLRESETFLSTDHALEMLVHSSAFQTIRLVAAENRDVVPMLAISCNEDVLTNRICISIYGEAFQGNGKEPFKVDSFISVRKTPAPHYTDEATIVNGLAASFQAACNTSSTLRMCHVLPIALTAAPAQSQDSNDAATAGSAAAVLSGTLLQAAAPLKLTQLNCMRVLESMLSARLMRPAAAEGASGDAFRTGLLSIEQSRALVPLLHSDPMADRAPLVGIWVTGVTKVWHPFTVAAAMAFHACAATRRCKALAPDNSFLLLMFPSGRGSRQPDLFEAHVNAPHGLPLLPRSISLEVPAASPQEHRSGDAAASRIPSPHAASALQEMRAAALVERPTLMHCLQSSASVPATATPAIQRSATGSRGESPDLVGRDAAGEPAAASGARSSLATWQSDPPVSAPPAHHHTENSAAPAMPAPGAAGAGGSGRSSSMSYGGSRATSRSALAAWSREFAPQGRGAGGSVRADTPTGAVAPNLGPPGYMQRQHLVTPRLNDMQRSAQYPSQGAGLHTAAAGMRGGMPAVPAPSSMVADSFKGYTQQGRQGMGQGGAAPAAVPDVPRGVAQWRPTPAASVTGTGPLSLGSLPPVGATPSQFTGATAMTAAGRAGDERGRSVSALQQSQSGGAQATGQPAPQRRDDLPPGMPEWLTSAVGRHPELAVLLERNIAEDASDGAACAGGQEGDGSAAVEPAADQPPMHANGGNEIVQDDTSRAAIKRQRDADEGRGGGDVPDGGAAAADDADTAALAALLDGDVGSHAAEGEAAADGSLHAALAPGGMSEAELAAMATRSPSHASPVHKPGVRASAAAAAMPADEDEGAAGVLQELDLPAAQGGGHDAASPSRHHRGPSEPHRAVKSPRVAPSAVRDRLKQEGVEDVGAADAQLQGMAVGVPAVTVGQAAPGAVMPSGPTNPLAQLMPMPVLQCSDPEAAAALAPLYSYISRLQRHIEVLQAQLQTGQGQPLPQVPAQVVQRLQAAAPPPGPVAGPFPGVPSAVPHPGGMDATAPDSPPAMPPAAVAVAAPAPMAAAAQHPQRRRDGPGDNAADATHASPVQHAFRVVRASGRHSAVSPSVDPLALRPGEAAGTSAGGPHGVPQRGLRQDLLRDSLEAAAANFLGPGQGAREQADGDPAAAGGASSDQRSRSVTLREAAPPQPHHDRTPQRQRVREASMYGGSDRSQIQASWPGQRDVAENAAQSQGSSRAPSRQLTGAMFGGSPDKVFSTDELKAAVAAAEAAAEAAGGVGAARPVPAGHASMSEDAADAIVDSFLVASHSPDPGASMEAGRRPGKAASEAAVRTSLSSKRLTSQRAPAARPDWDRSHRAATAAHEDGAPHARRPSHGRDWDSGGGQESPAPLPRQRAGQRHQPSGSRRHDEPAPAPVAAAASTLDASSVCPETEAPSTPAALSHGRTQGGSTASVAAPGDRAAQGRSPGCVRETRRAGASDNGRTTCLSPELAALIADAAVEHCTSGAPSSRPASRALVCVPPEDEAPRRRRGRDREMHGSQQRAPPRWATASQHAAAPPAYDLHGSSGDGGHLMDSGARWSTASASTLGAVPPSQPRSQHRPAARVMPEIPRIKFPQTKVGRKLQRRYLRKKGQAVDSSSTSTVGSDDCDSDSDSLDRKYGRR